MWPESAETIKSLIFQYFFYPAGLLIFLRNRQFNWRKYQSSAEEISHNPSLTHFINPSFKGVKRLFVNSWSTQFKVLSPKGLGNCIACKKLATQTLLGSLQYVTNQNLGRHATTVSNLGINWKRSRVRFTMARKPCRLLEGKGFLLTMKVLLKEKEMETLPVSIKVFCLSLPVIEAILSD